MICNEEVPFRKETLGSNLLWVLATFETPDQMSINLHVILSLNPGIVEYHPAYFSHCAHTFLVILVRRICLMTKALGTHKCCSFPPFS